MLADKYHSVVLVIGTAFILQACESITMPALPSFDLSSLSDPASFFNRGDSSTADDTTDAHRMDEADLSTPPLTCLAHDGSANFKSDWYDFSPVSFEIRQRQRQNITIPRRWGKNEMELEVHFAESGQKLTFCALETPEAEDEIICASLYALENDFTRGIKRTFDVPDAIRGGTIECQYDAKLRL